MNLDKLLEGVDALKIWGKTMGVEVMSVEGDSRRVVTGSVFVAIKGNAVDGLDFVKEAAIRGASAIFAETEPLEEYFASCKNSKQPVWIKVEDSRLTLAKLAATFHGLPSRRLKMAGVTGTNGKTSTALMLYEIISAGTRPAALVGTVRRQIGDTSFPSERTTPDAVSLQMFLARALDEGCFAASVEVSSHAIDQKRTAFTEFDVAAFSNLSQEHLDYHGDMESYFQAKRAWFVDLLLQNKRAKGRKASFVINGDDMYGTRLIDEFKKDKNLREIISYGFGGRHDFGASDPVYKIDSTSFKLRARGREYLVKTPFIGRFNIYNSLSALASAVAMRMNLRESIRALADCPQIPGRMQRIVAFGKRRIFIDYAHTPDALRNAMLALRQLDARKIIVVFGAGGNRDKGKRALMGAVADKLADRIYLCSDNPRNEDPQKIIDEISHGVKSTPTKVIQDRREAISQAVQSLRAGEVLLIAGKGHEDYQQVGDQRLPFSDEIVVRDILGDLNEEVIARRKEELRELRRGSRAGDKHERF